MALAIASSTLTTTASWQAAISAQLDAGRGAERAPQYQGRLFDAIFDRYERNGLVYLRALAELAAAGAWHAIADPIDEIDSSDPGISANRCDGRRAWSRSCA